ncbi:MAG: PAS domain-containing sensor histidine kinase [Methanolobus sp.]|nr:PAS domain-containing sensor histidine kinase [Methanolobus sp.]
MVNSSNEYQSAGNIDTDCSIGHGPLYVLESRPLPGGLEQARIFFDTLNSLILTTDTEHRILSMNRMAEKLLGYKDNELAGKNWIDTLVHESSRELLKDAFLEIISGNTAISEPLHSLIIGKDVPEIVISWNVTFLKDDDGSPAGFILAGNDISRQKAIELNCIHENERLLSFLRSATYAVIFSDHSGMISFWNKAATTLFGYDEAEVMGEPLTVIMPKRYKKAHEGWDQIISIGKSPVMGRIFEASGLRKDGSEFPLEIAATTTRMNGKVFHGAFLNDISRRKMKERLTTISKNKYRMIFQKSPLGIFHFDEKGVITQCNEKLVKIVGAAHENVISTIINFNMLTSFKDEAMVKCIKQVLSGIPARYEDDFISPFSDKVVPIKAEFSPVISEEGKLMGGVCVVEDFTERKTAEKALSKYAEDLAKANTELKSLDRMKDEFLSNLRHELKTPLIPIRGYSELMAEGALGELNEKQKDAMEKVLLSSERLKRLIDSLLYVSITEGGNAEYTFVLLRVAEVLESAICDRSPEMISKGHKIEKDLPRDLPLIEGDLEYLTDVFVNLIDNAIKFTPSGGNIRICAAVEDSNIHIQISDDGIGIEEANLPKIFTRFYQVDGSSTRKYGGNGLGLYICKKIVEAHKGSIRLESIRNRGTTIHVYLPVVTIPLCSSSPST